MQVIQTFGAFRLTLFPLWPGLASFPSCLGRRVPVRLQIRPDLITMANQNVLSHILFEGWTENKKIDILQVVQFFSEWTSQRG